jgi:hypothetical protein
VRRSDREIDIHPALKDGDSFCKTAMSDRENVLGRVNIAVVTLTTAVTDPFSYSKTCDTFRPRIGLFTATRTGLGGVGITARTI